VIYTLHVVSSLSQFSTGMKQFLHQTLFLSTFYLKTLAGNNLNVAVSALGVDVCWKHNHHI